MSAEKTEYFCFLRTEAIMLKKLIISFLSVCLGSLGVCPAIADTLAPGEEIKVGDSVFSNNRQYRLILQTDGNLVLYQEGVKALWWSGTQGRAVARAVMQTDGNFVLYSPNNVAVWYSGTQGRPGAFLNIQDDGNLVIYTPAPIWNTNTAISGQPSPLPPPQTTPPQTPTTITICVNQPSPEGYIKINDYWDPIKCPSQPGSLAANVAVLARYITLPVGSTLAVCYDATVPSGWTVTNTFYNPTVCSHPTVFQNNVVRIKRIS